MCVGSSEGGCLGVSMSVGGSLGPARGAVGVCECVLRRWLV